METSTKVLIAVVAVAFMALIAPYLVATAWSDNTPAMVWVPSESMLNENGTILDYGIISPGDLVVLRSVNGTRIVPYEIGKVMGYRTFGDYGDVIVYEQPETGNLIIHRVMFWFDPNNPIDVENHPECVGMKNAGWITKGDNNPVYDQLANVSPYHPITNEEIVGVARMEVPLIGWAYSLVS